MVGVTVVVEELAVVLVTGVVVVVVVAFVGTLQSSATKRKIIRLLSYSKRAE